MGGDEISSAEAGSRLKRWRGAARGRLSRPGLQQSRPLARLAVHRHVLDQSVEHAPETGELVLSNARTELDPRGASQMKTWSPTLRKQAAVPLPPSPTSPGTSKSSPCETPLSKIAESDWRASVDANLTAIFLTVKAFLPAMKRRHHGVIVTMSSAAARRTTAQSPMAYAAAKAGIAVLSKELAAQAVPYGVRVNCLAPGRS